MALTLIDPTSSWLKVVELPTITQVTTKKVNGKERTTEEEIFDRSSDQISRLVNKIWLCTYPRCRYLIYHNGSEFKLHFETLCDSYGMKHKPTRIKNPQANAICECLHQVLGTMMCTAELDMADSVYPADIDTFIDNAVWAICSTYHTVLKASPGAAIFGQDMLFNIQFVADWHKIGGYRQRQTDCSNRRENNKCVDYNYKVGDKVLIRKDGILHKTESIWKNGP